MSHETDRDSTRLQTSGYIFIDHDKYDKQVVNSEEWTSAYLIDQLTLQLVKVEDTIKNNNDETVKVRKYKFQAQRLARWLPIARPAPEYLVYASDLTERLKDELKALHPYSLKAVLKDAVGTLFENLDFEKYHLRIARNLVVKIVWD